MNAIVLALIVLLSQSAEERMRAGEVVEAAATLEEQLRQPGLSDTATAALLVELGNAYRSAGSPAGAEPHLQRAAALAEKAKDRGLLVSALHSLGMVIRQRGRGAFSLQPIAFLLASTGPGRH